MKNFFKKRRLKKFFLILFILIIIIISIHLTTKSCYTKYGKSVIKIYETSRFYPFITKFLTPASHEILFSNDSQPIDKIKKNIDTTLKDLGKTTNVKQLKKSINNIEGVLSATFVRKEDKLTLVTDKNQIRSGQKIWRKLPNIVIPNFFYGETDFLKAFKKADLYVEKIFRPKFNSEEDRLNYNNKVSLDFKLDQNYVKHQPFIIYYLRKIN